AAYGALEEVKEYVRAHPFVPDRGTLTGRVGLERRVVHIPDVLSDPEYTYHELQKIAGYRSMLGVPLLRGDELIGTFSLHRTRDGGSAMKAPSVKTVRCAIYTRVSTEHGLDQEVNSLDAQYDAASAYIKGQAHAGWTMIRSRSDDVGYSGWSTDRPDLQRLRDDTRARTIDVIVVYKVDRLTGSLA